MTPAQDPEQRLIDAMTALAAVAASCVPDNPWRDTGLFLLARAQDALIEAMRRKGNGA